MTLLTPPVTVLSVEGKNINTKKGPGVIYEVKASDGRTYSTFLQPLAQKASGFQGQVATLSYKERQNGQYTNYDLEGVFGADELPPAADVSPVLLPSVQVVPIPTAPPATIPIAAPVNHDLRDLKIQRQAAQRTAATFIAGLYAGAGPEHLHEAIGNMRKLTADLLEHTAGGEWAGGITVPAVEQEIVPVQAAQQPQNPTGIEW